MRQRTMKIILRFLIFAIIVNLPIISITQENRLQIVASHSISGDVVRNVAGNVADVHVTMPAGVDPHSFQAVPADLVTLANADVVFINGAFYEESLLEVIENAGSDMTIATLSSCIDMLAFDARTHEEHDEHEIDTSADLTETCSQHYDEIGYTSPDFETIGTLYATDCDAECDPHVWMIPENVMLWALVIRDTLIELDPENAETYIENTASYLLALDELEHNFIRPMIDNIPVENRLLVTNHDSLGYFAAQYGFEIVSTVMSGGGGLAEPGASEIVATIQEIRERGVTAIFAETTLGDGIIQQISNETGVDIFILYSGSLSSDDGEASTYLDYMHYNVTTIVESINGND